MKAGENAADWWDSLVTGLGYERWDWGITADWFAAVGTVGALILGLVILLRDLSKESRAQYAKVITRYNVEVGPMGGLVRTSAYNANEHPIPLVTLNSWIAGAWQRDIMVAPISVEIAPRSTGTAAADFISEDHLKDKNYFYLIQDGDGKEWYRGVYSNQRRRKWRVAWWERRGWYGRYKARLLTRLRNSLGKKS